MSHQQQPIQKDRYSSKEVVEAAGITYRQLDYWVRCGFIWPSINDSKGSGDARLFSPDDLDRALRIKKMIDKGFTLRAAVFRIDRNEDR